MKTVPFKIHELNAAKAFSKQSSVFDDEYVHNKIVTYKRQRVRAHLQKFLAPHSRILELNSGTGDDAIWFASQGHTVHATDISAGMQTILKQKVVAAGFEEKISTERCSFTKLYLLQNNQPYDCIFSNFAGLNCADDLRKVLVNFDALLKQNGTITLVLMPKFSLWEFLLLFKGEFKTAFRRLFSKKGAKAHILGEHFRCWYYHPSYIINYLKDSFKLQQLEGMCTIVPPSFIENFPNKFPKFFKFLVKQEDQLKSIWPFTVIGDYYIITLKKQ